MAKNRDKIVYNGKTYNPGNPLPEVIPSLRKPPNFRFRDPEDSITDPDADLSKYIRIPDDGPPQKRGFERPWLIIPGTNKAFVWPGGVEGFTLEGRPELGIYKYIGDVDIDAIVVYPDEPRITLTGTFPGNTSDGNMIQLRSLLALAQVSHERGMVLHVPYILPRAQYVLCDNYSFSHAVDERTQNIDYNVSFLKIGEGSRIKDTKPTNPTSERRGSSTKGKPQRFYTVKANRSTMRSVVSDLYGSDIFITEDRYANAAAQIYKANEKTFRKEGITLHRAGTMKLPPGIKLRY